MALSRCIVLLSIFSLNDVLFPENGPRMEIGDILAASTMQINFQYSGI